MNTEQIARVCHEANRALCQTIGDDSQKPWEGAEQWQRDSAMAGVVFAIINPDAPAHSQHDAWMSDKFKDGWVWGPVKNASIKQHPCMVPYEHLPLEQRLKDHIFRGIVKAFIDCK